MNKKAYISPVATYIALELENEAMTMNPDSAGTNVTTGVTGETPSGKPGVENEEGTGSDLSRKWLGGSFNDLDDDF